MDDKRFEMVEWMSGLIVKYVNKTITADELNDLHNWAYANRENREIFEEWLHSGEFQDSLDDMIALDKEAALREIQLKIAMGAEETVPMPAGRWRSRIALAASIIGLIGISAALYLGLYRRDTGARPQMLQAYNNETAPGGDKAVLTLADGSRIILDSAENGTLARQGDAEVQKLGNKEIKYTTAARAPATISYNTLSTPRGEQYQVVLPDGTRVWLNAASSLRYPTSFAGKERSVELTGEGYFEVARGADHSTAQGGSVATPFMVSANGMQIKVLGTHFNVNCYSDEPVKQTTLLEGSVEVSQGNEKVLIHPGERAEIGNRGGIPGTIRIAKNVDLNDAVQWKEGVMSFDDADIQAIMRKISRWYNVDVVYEGYIPERKFRGGISQTSSLIDLLDILKINGINCALINGKTIVVRP